MKKHREAGNAQEELEALFYAVRLTEAYALAMKLTVKEEKEVSLWLARGAAAISMGEAADSIASYEKALALDPKAKVPDYVKAARKTGDRR